MKKKFIESRTLKSWVNDFQITLFYHSFTSILFFTIFIFFENTLLKVNVQNQISKFELIGSSK